jgi:hypothetical protein
MGQGRCEGDQGDEETCNGESNGLDGFHVLILGLIWMGSLTGSLE